MPAGRQVGMTMAITPTSRATETRSRDGIAASCARRGMMPKRFRAPNATSTNNPAVFARTTAPYAERNTSSGAGRTSSV